jgi:membrane protein DedA with SNARE-associated domain
MEEALQGLLEYGYVILFIGMLLDASGIPFPGDLLLLAAGYLVYRGEMIFAVVIPVAATAAVTGDTFTFSLGKAVCRARGTFVLRLYCRWTECTYSSKDCFQRACDAFKSLGKKSIILSKFMWGAREFIPPVAGLSGMTYRHFLWMDVIGVLLWVAAFVLAGRFLGMQAEVLLGQLEDTVMVLSVFIAAGFALIFSVKNFKRGYLGKTVPSTKVPE